MKFGNPKISVTGEVTVKISPQMCRFLGDHEFETNPVTVVGSVGFKTAIIDHHAFNGAIHKGLAEAFKRASNEALENLKKDKGGWRCKTHSKSMEEEMKELGAEAAAALLKEFLEREK